MTRVRGAFVLFGIIGITIFATGGLGSSDEPLGPVVVWGTLPANGVEGMFSSLKENHKEALEEVTYIEKSEASYIRELVNAIAAGNGPDLFFLNNEQILLHEDKIQRIPYEFFSERDFKNTFLEEGELFLSGSGILALPAMVDPLILYWNRNIFSSSGVSLPPKFWDEVQVLASERLTKRDAASNISQSAIALGEYQNINNAKEILSMLIMQAGSPISARDENGVIRSFLRARLEGSSISSTETALRFYTDMSNPSKSVYSWNRSLPEARSAFIANKLAMYVGFASELQGIRSQNPNLNFDIAEVPQVRDAATKSTYGKMQTLAETNIATPTSVQVRVTFALSILSTLP